jgi:hypothetical protein
MTISLDLRLTGPQPTAVDPIPAEATRTNTGTEAVALHPGLGANSRNNRHTTTCLLRSFDPAPPLILEPGATHVVPCQIVVPATILREDDAVQELSLSFKARLYTKPADAPGALDDGDFNLAPLHASIDVPVRRDGVTWLDTDYGTRSRFFCHDGGVYFARSDGLPSLLEGASASDARAITHAILISHGKLFQSDFKIKRQPKGEITGLSDVFYQVGDAIMTSYGGAKIADPSTFQVIGTGERSLFSRDDHGYRCGYGRDATQAYYFCESTSPSKANVVRACKSPDTLQPLGYSYARDATSVYLEGKRITKADGPSFTLLNGHFGRDKRGIWYSDTLLSDVDPETFELIPDRMSPRDPNPLLQTRWGRDAKGLIKSFSRATEDEYTEEMEERMDY